MENQLAVIHGNPEYVVKVHMTNNTYLTGCTRYIFNPDDEAVTLLNDFHQPFHKIDMKSPGFLRIEIFNPSESAKIPEQTYLRKPRGVW